MTVLSIDLCWHLIFGDVVSAYNCSVTNNLLFFITVVRFLHVDLIFKGEKCPAQSLKQLKSNRFGPSKYTDAKRNFHTKVSQVLTYVTQFVHGLENFYMS